MSHGGVPEHKITLGSESKGDGMHEPCLHMDGKKVNATLTEDLIRIGCTTITVEAADWILRRHKAHFEIPNILTI